MSIYEEVINLGKWKAEKKRQQGTPLGSLFEGIGETLPTAVNARIKNDRDTQAAGRLRAEKGQEQKFKEQSEFRQKAMLKHLEGRVWYNADGTQGDTISALDEISRGGFKMPATPGKDGNLPVFGANGSLKGYWGIDPATQKQTDQYVDDEVLSYDPETGALTGTGKTYKKKLGQAPEIQRRSTKSERMSGNDPDKVDYDKLYDDIQRRLQYVTKEGGEPGEYEALSQQLFEIGNKRVGQGNISTMQRGKVETEVPATGFKAGVRNALSTGTFGIVKPAAPVKTKTPGYVTVPPQQQEQQAQPTAQPQIDAGEVIVEKDGKRFALPAGQLQEAIRQGYREVK